MHARPATIAVPAHPPASDRRTEPRQPVIGCLWMIDNHSSSILRCRCVDISRTGMRLRVPLSYGVEEGRRYELTSQLPGQSSPPGLALMFSRRAKVIRTQMVRADDEYDVEIGVALVPATTGASGAGAPITAPAAV